MTPSSVDQDAPLDVVAGAVAQPVRDEFPELRLLSVTLQARAGSSPDGVRLRLKELSDRFRGSHAVAMRQTPIAHAYRVFYRHIGLDPDSERTPGEAAAVDRLLHGRFKSRNLLDDALTIALVETGVPLWALDADRVEGALALRAAEYGERLGRDPAAPPVPDARLVVADARSPLAVLFGDLAPGHGVTRGTSRMTLFTLAVAGVPAIHVEEALYTCVELLHHR
jgi:DNA/RNA-binding domain of Phe-tRNA-synthetase-like protein